MALGGAETGAAAHRAPLGGPANGHGGEEFGASGELRPLLGLPNEAGEEPQGGLRAVPLWRLRPHHRHLRAGRSAGPQPAACLPAPALGLRRLGRLRGGAEARKNDVHRPPLSRLGGERQAERAVG